MPRKDNWKPRLKRIDDVLVEGDFYFKQWNGRTRKIRVVVGRPIPSSDGDAYFCPIQAEGCFKGVKLVGGADALQSVMLAMRMLSHYSDFLHGMVDNLEYHERPTLRRYPFKRLPPY